MTNELDSADRSTPRRAIVAQPASALAGRLLERARRQHREGPPPFKVLHSGLPILDVLLHSCWGLTLLVGAVQAGKTTLAARIALETARAGTRVLWLELGANPETPVFRLLTGLARVPATSVFVRRVLSGDQWGALAAARAELETLPFELADAHGATTEELRGAVLDAARTRPPGLVIVDGLGAPERLVLLSLEALAEEVDVPILAVVTQASTVAWDQERELLRGDLPQRPGSLRLRLSREEPDGDRRHPEYAPLWLDVHRAGEGFRTCVQLRYDARFRWIEEAEPG